MWRDFDCERSKKNFLCCADHRSRIKAPKRSFNEDCFSTAVITIFLFHGLRPRVVKIVFICSCRENNVSDTVEVTYLFPKLRKLSSDKLKASSLVGWARVAGDLVAGMFWKSIPLITLQLHNCLDKAVTRNSNFYPMIHSPCAFKLRLFFQSTKSWTPLSKTSTLSHSLRVALAISFLWKLFM